MSAVFDVLGVGRVIDRYTGELAVLRWLSIHPDGRVVPRQSDNLIGWSVEYRMSVQILLLRDVYRVVDPSNRGFPPAAMLVRTEAHGSVVVARDRGVRQLPPNPVATAMLAALGAVRDVHGTAAWLGVSDPVRGLHADLDRINELRVLAAHCRSG